MQSAPPSLLMEGPSQRGFYIGLYLEYLQEASFLYEHRLTLYDDPEINWLDIEDFEERFEAHIDALVIGETLALDVCRMRAAQGDFGELHAALRVFCRQQRADLLQEALEQAELDDDTITAITEALKHELPQAWSAIIGKMLLSGETMLIRLAAAVTGFRRLALGDELLKIMWDKTIAPMPEVICAIGRVGAANARHSLLALLDNTDDAIAYESALALLRLGDNPIAGDLARKATVMDWPLKLIGISGRSEHVAILHGIYHNRRKSHDLLLAMGFLGDVSSIALLVDTLADEVLGMTAAMALNLITGANLYKEVFIPEETDEDALFEDEREKMTKGESFQGSGDPPGEYVARPSTDSEAWRAWWQQNAQRFDPTLRHRNGKPFALAAVVETLLLETSPDAIRKLAYEEWVIQSGKNIDFETDYPVATQKQRLLSMAQARP